MTSREEILDQLHELLSIPSVTAVGTGDTPFGPETARALNWVLELCRKLGFRTKNCGGMTGWAEIGQGSELVGILVHLDVVPAGEGWTYPPFACTRANGILYGRGVSDDKGPALACIYAMKELLDSGIPLKRRIRIIFGQSEEKGEWRDMAYYRTHEELPTFGFTPDGQFPALCGEKGIAEIRLSYPLEGSGLTRLEAGQARNIVPSHCRAECGDRSWSARGRSAHGSTPERGQNAISLLMEQLAGIPVADFYNALLGFDLHGERLGCALSDPHSTLTLNVGMVHTTDQAIVFTLDIRYPVTCSLAQVVDPITAAVAPYGVSVEVGEHMAPIYLDPDGPLITALLSAYQEVTGDRDSRPQVIGGGTYAKAMANIAAFGPTLPGREGSEHQADEHISEEDYFLLLRIYRAALERLAR